MGIQQAVFAILDGAGVAGGRITPILLPQDAALPAVTYETVSTVPMPALDGAVGRATTRIRLHCWGETYADARATAAAARAALDDTTGTVAGCAIGWARCEIEADLYEDATRTHRVVLDYLIHHAE